MGKKQLSDKDLIILALQGRQSAYFEVYNKYIDGLYAHILKYIPDPEDAKDICQESFKKAFQQLPTYNPEYKFSTWLYRIGKNTALDYLKQKRNEVFSAIDDSVIMQMIGLTPEEEIVFTEMKEEVVKALYSLSDIYRIPAELRFIKEYGYEEIAKELDIPLNTVKARIMRAKLAIVTMLKKKPDDQK